MSGQTWRIDPTGPKAPYVQIADRLRVGIRSGEYAPGTRIPTQSEIAELTEVALTTVRRAIKLLRDEGWIYTVPTRGSFVAPPNQWPV